MTICAVAGGKGGVGRTTTAINVAAAMEQFGHDTVVVEGDLDMGDLADTLGVAADESIQSLLAGSDDLDAALVDTVGDLTVLPGENSLEAYAETDPARFRDVLDTLADSFDLVVVDTAAGVRTEATVPLGLADEILLVTTPTESSVEDAKLTADLVRRVDNSVTGAVVTRATPETDIYGLGDRLAVPILGVVPDDPAAFAAEPLMVRAVESTAAVWYGRLSNRLADCVFADGSPAELEGQFHDEWFGEGGQPVIAGGESDETGEVSGSDDAEEEDDAPYLASTWMHEGY